MNVTINNKSVSMNVDWLWNLISNPSWWNNKVRASAPKDIAKNLFKNNKEKIETNKNNLEDLLNEILPDKEQRDKVIKELEEKLSKS